METIMRLCHRELEDTDSTTDCTTWTQRRSGSQVLRDKRQFLLLPYLAWGMVQVPLVCNKTIRITFDQTQTPSLLSSRTPLTQIFPTFYNRTMGCSHQISGITLIFQTLTRVHGLPQTSPTANFPVFWQSTIESSYQTPSCMVMITLFKHNLSALLHRASD